MSDFYRKLDEAEIRGRAERMVGNRPENLHDYQGCAEQVSAAEQTDEQKVAAVLKRHEHAVTSHTALAAEIVAALRDGKEGK